MSPSEEYRLALSNLDTPIFYQPWWLDAICGEDNWEGLVFKKGEDIRAIWPVIFKTKLGKKIIYHPPLHAYGGVRMFVNEDQKYASKLGMEHEALSYFIDKLKNSDWLMQKFYPGFHNWLPFYWAGFRQQLRYTYTLDLQQSESQLFSEFRENIRREIRKAEKKIVVSECQDIEALYALLKKSKESVLDFSLEHVTRVFDAAKDKGQIMLLQANDDNGKTHSMGMFAWDNFAAYYLLGASDPQFKNSGSMSLLMWEAIKKSMANTSTFNFEGSMIESIERFFRGFGAQQQPFFELEKNNSLLLRTIHTIKKGIT